MKNLKVWLIILLVLIIGLVLIYSIASRFLSKAPPEIAIEIEEEAAEVPRIDYLVPNFELLDIKGEEVKLSNYQDKIIVLSFWTTWNPAAQDQLVILESYYQDIKDEEGVVLLTINNQEDESVVSNFIRRGEYSLPVLLDQDGEIGELYGISILPATFFINKEGKVKEIYIGILNKEEIEDKAKKLYTG